MATKHETPGPCESSTSHQNQDVDDLLDLYVGCQFACFSYFEDILRRRHDELAEGMCQSQDREFGGLMPGRVIPRTEKSVNVIAASPDTSI